MDFGLASPFAERLHESVDTAQVGYLGAKRHRLEGLLQEHLLQARWVHH